MANVSSSNGLEKYPKLRFPGFEEPWKPTAFGELVCEFSERTKVEDEDTLLSAAIEGMFLNTELFGHQRGASNKGYKKIRRGTMVLSTQNLHLGNANVNLRFEHGMVSPAYKTYEIKGCSVDLIAQWIKSEAAKRFFYNATTVGASVCRRNVEWETLYEQALYLPNVAEQEKIAGLLTLLSNRISKQQQFVAALKKYKRGLLRATFTQEVLLTNSATWERRKFSEIASLRRAKYTPSRADSRACVELEHIEQQTGRLINYVDSAEQNSIKSVFKRGDVLFGKLRPYLRKYCLPQFDGVCSSEIWVLVPEACVVSEYLFYLVQSDEFLATANISSGTKMPRAEWSKVSNEDYFIPPISEQKRIARMLSIVDHRITTANEMLSALERMRKSFLQQVFI